MWTSSTTLTVNLGAQATILWDGAEASNTRSIVSFVDTPLPIHAWWSTGQTDADVLDAALFIPENPYAVEYPDDPTPPTAVLDAPTHGEFE